MTDTSSNLKTFRPIIIFLGIIWAFQIANFFMDYDLNGWLGLSTRRSAGLIGIIFCPFLHGSFNHAALNSAPLALMGAMILGINRKGFVPATAIIFIIGGFLTWLMARPNTVHVGASGVVFGYLGYLVTYGIISKRIVAIAAGVFAVVVYGYMLKGVLPSGPGVSFEGHLFGLVAGVAAALILPKQ